MIDRLLSPYWFSCSSMVSRESRVPRAPHNPYGLARPGRKPGGTASRTLNTYRWLLGITGVDAVGDKDHGTITHQHMGTAAMATTRR